MDTNVNGTSMGFIPTPGWEKPTKQIKLLNNWIISGITVIAIDALTNQPVRGWIATKTLPLQEGVDISVQGHGVCILGTPRIPKDTIPVIDDWILADPGAIIGFYSGTKVRYSSGYINEQITRNEHGFAQNIYSGAILQDKLIGPIRLGNEMSDETDASII